MARTPRLRYLRHGQFSRVRRRDKKLIPFLAERATALAATGTSDTFTTDVQTAVGVLTLTGNAVQNETVTIDTTVYTWKTNIEAQFAVGTLTLTGNALNTETVTIGTKVYTFQTVLTNVDGNVLIGALATDSIDNLIAAITLGAGSGTLYAAATTAHPTATAAAGAGDTMTVTALTAGTAGNSIASTETLTNGSFGGATLSGGEAAEAAYAVEIGALATDSIDNLVAAITAGAGAGTLYGTGTVAHTTVTAAAGAGDTMDVTATVAGTEGNAIATTETMTNGSFGAATLAGGVTSNNLEAVGHPFVAGEGPLTVTSSGTSPAGLTEDASGYFIKTVVDVDNFTVSSGRKGGVVTITGDGTGVQTIARGEDEEAVFETLKKNHPAVVAAATDIDDL